MSHQCIQCTQLRHKERHIFSAHSILGVRYQREWIDHREVRQKEAPVTHEFVRGRFSVFGWFRRFCSFSAVTVTALFPHTWYLLQFYVPPHSSARRMRTAFVAACRRNTHAPGGCREKSVFLSCRNWKTLQLSWPPSKSTHGQRRRPGRPQVKCIRGQDMQWPHVRLGGRGSSDRR